jgi:hypothetical protein
MVRELTSEELNLIDSKLEKFLNEEIWSWSVMSDDEETWDGEEMCLEEKVIREIINNLQNRISYY